MRILITTIILGALLSPTLARAKSSKHSFESRVLRAYHGKSGKPSVLTGRAGFVTALRTSSSYTR